MLKKLSLLLSEQLPGSRIYFIYTHKNGHDRFAKGLKANTEISYFSYSALKKAFPRVTFLKLEEENPKKIDRITSKDIVIGHIGKTYKEAAQKTQNVIAFYPWAGHLDRSENTLFNCIGKEEEFDYLSLARGVVLLTSEYNRSCYLEKPTNFWHPYFENWRFAGKSLRVVHQPIDFSFFRRIKHTYTTGDFLYVGNNAHMKGVEKAKELVVKVGKKLHLFGLEKGKFLDNLDKRKVNQLPLLADFFIQHGMWEAQCVSILEAAARGFIPVVTEETGYPYKHPFLLRYGDDRYNIKVLQDLLALSALERKNLADLLYAQLISDPNHNDWNVLGDTLVEEVKKIWVD